MNDLHQKVLRIFLLRLFLYSVAGSALISGIGFLLYLVHSYEIPVTLVVPIFILLLSIFLCISWLWHDTKYKVLDQNRIPPKK
jgi:hypothetical protein